MRRPVKGYIKNSEANYIEALLTSDFSQKKLGLQRLCYLYRCNFALADPRRIHQGLVALVFDDDPKVRRWSLNGLSLLGSKRDVPVILAAIEQNATEPDIIAAGVSALSAILGNPDEVKDQLSKKGLDLAGLILLAAAQQNKSFAEALSRERVDIELASIPELRMAEVLVGLNKAPEYLFHADIPNRNMIGQLNRHPDPIVSQYSIWATLENPGFSISDLEIELHDIPGSPENVRCYVNQLVASEPEFARNSHDFIVSASEDESLRAREGLATGLRDLYYDGIEELVLDWLHDDREELSVREKLMEHIARHAHVLPTYRDITLQEFRTSGERSLMRARILASARDGDLILELRKIEVMSNNLDLFDQLAGPNVTNNQHFHGPVTAGGISMSGTGTSGNPTVAQYNVAASEALQRLIDILHKVENPDLKVVEGRRLAEEARAKPTKSGLQKVAEFMKHMKDIGHSVQSLSGDFGDVYNQISDLAGTFPSA